MTSNAGLSSLPNGLLLITLLSNFGTFLLYGLTNIICIVAFREHHEFSGFKHMVVPVFGAVVNFGRWKEPIFGVILSLIWGLYGAVYFARNSRRKGKATVLVAKPT